MSKNGRGRPVSVIELSGEDRVYLEGLSRRRNASSREVERSRIILLAAEGLSNKAIAERFDLNAQTVGYWRRRFALHGVAGLSELPRSGRPRSVSDEQVAEVVRLTLEHKPEARTHWSSYQMAQHTGLSQSTISRIWRAFKLQPHRRESFTLSRPLLCRQGARCRRPVHEPSRQRSGLLPR